MKIGDLVHFRPPYYIAKVDGVFTPEAVGEWRLGLLIECHKLEKMTTVMHESELLHIQAQYVQPFLRN